jgi:hypothetical protein
MGWAANAIVDRVARKTVDRRLRLSVHAPLARAAAAHEWCGNTVADGPSSYVGAHRGNNSDELVTGNVWERYLVVMPGPRVPVTPTKTGSALFNDHPSRRWCRIGDGPDIHRTTELLIHHSAHKAKSARRSRDYAADLSRMCTPQAEPSPMTWARPTFAFWIWRSPASPRRWWQISQTLAIPVAAMG